MFNFGQNPTEPMNFGSLALLDKAQSNNPLSGAGTSSTPDWSNIWDSAATSQLAQAGSSNSWWDNMVGTKDSPGWGGMAVGAAQAGANFYLGNKQLGLAEDQLETQKNQFDQQFSAQKQQVNSEIYDKGANKYAFDSARSETPDVYFEKNKIV